MSRSVKRYGLVRGTNGYPWWIGECEDGEYVPYEDYAALLDASAWRPVSEPPEIINPDWLGDGHSSWVLSYGFPPEVVRFERCHEDGPLREGYFNRAGERFCPSRWRPIPEGPK